LIAGASLVGVSWSLNWGLSGLRTHLLFFPLWLGYVLAVDGWCERRTGSSAWRRSPRLFVARFAVSLPAWWLFELANLRLRNWEYLGREHFGQVSYAVLASVSFSTVLPDLLGTAELLASGSWLERFARGPRWCWTRGRRLGVPVAGAAMGVLMLAWPRIFYPFLWVAGVLLLEPLALASGRPALSRGSAVGDWRLPVVLSCAGLTCGLLWETWNAFSYPRWVNHVPGVGFAHVFEMPLLGYLGYLPFALEAFLLAGLCDPRLVAGLAPGDRGGLRPVLREPT